MLMADWEWCAWLFLGMGVFVAVVSKLFKWPQDPHNGIPDFTAGPGDIE